MSRNEECSPEDIARRAQQREMITQGEHEAMVEAYAVNTGDLIVDTVLWGKPTTSTVGMIQENIGKKLSILGYMDLLEFARPAIQSAIKSYRSRYGDESTTLQSIRRRLNREVKEREKFAGVTPAPATLIRNSTITKQFLMNWDETDGRNLVNAHNGEEYAGVEIAPNYRETLSSWEATYTLDAIQTYISDFWEGRDTPHLQIDDQDIIIEDSFNNFCERANITGENRKLVKKALFPEGDRAGPLERVQFIKPHPEKRDKQVFFETYFVISYDIRGEQYKNSFDSAGKEIWSFKLRIQRGLYQYLLHRDAIQTGRGRKQFSGGYMQIPKVLNSKIERILDLLHDQSEFEPIYRSIRYNRKGFGQATRYVLSRWIRGAQNRQNDMEVTWAELSDRGYLALHKKDRKHRRTLDMKALHAICLHLWRDKEAFGDCRGIEHTKYNTILFQLEE
jgi:hypothetical protein